MENRNRVLEVFKSLPLTFFSAAFYRHVVREWTGIGAGFILIIAAFGFILASAGMYLQSKTQDRMKMEDLFAQLPEATIKDHKLSIDAPSPYTIKLFPPPPEATAKYQDPKDETIPNNLVIDTGFDSTDKTVTKDYMQKHDAFFLVTATRIIFQNRNGLQVDNLPDMADRRFTHDDWRTIGRTMDKWTYPVSTLFIAIGLVAVNFIAAFCGGGVAFLLSLIARAQLDYPAAMRLAASAAIPATAITELFHMPFAVRIVVWLGYSIFGLVALRRTSKPAG